MPNWFLDFRISLSLQQTTNERRHEQQQQQQQLGARGEIQGEEKKKKPHAVV